MWCIGGFTTLAALAFRKVFKAGASHFGVSDLEALAKDTHKFESRYLDGLIGPYPEKKDLYVERSPIHHVENLSEPLILLQGDKHFTFLNSFTSIVLSPTTSGQHVQS